MDVLFPFSHKRRIIPPWGKSTIHPDAEHTLLFVLSLATLAASLAGLRGRGGVTEDKIPSYGSRKYSKKSM